MNHGQNRSETSRVREPGDIESTARDKGRSPVRTAKSLARKRCTSRSPPESHRRLQRFHTSSGCTRNTAPAPRVIPSQDGDTTPGWYGPPTQWGRPVAAETARELAKPHESPGRRRKSQRRGQPQTEPFQHPRWTVAANPEPVSNTRALLQGAVLGQKTTCQRRGKNYPDAFNFPISPRRLRPGHLARIT
jgi:hypothetical protein